MLAARRAAEPSTQGHVIICGRSARWRQAVAKSLAGAGHSHAQAANPDELRRQLASQRFDVLALKVRDEADAEAFVEAMDGVRLPYHGILIGSASALPLIAAPRNNGALRYVPGRVTAQGLSRLVEASISAGTWYDEPADTNGCAPADEALLEDIIERAASAVYAQARRRRQRFTTVVEGPVLHVAVNATKLRRTLVTLLKLVLTLAPRGALVAVEARAGKDEWLVRICAEAASGDGRRRQLADALHDETRSLAAVSADVQGLGGMLWVELLGPATLAVCLTLPLPPEGD